MRKIYSFILLLSLLSCKSSQHIKNNKDPMNGKNEATASVIIYKTTKDFSDLVPVIMDAGRMKIVSYPAPTDLFYQSELAKPTDLKNGYLLDNRGISENVVFLKYTYENYSKLTEAPSLKELMSNIADKYPLKEMIYCGKRNQYKEEIKELNVLIEKGFPGCKKAKITPMGVNFE